MPDLIPSLCPRRGSWWRRLTSHVPLLGLLLLVAPACDSEGGADAAPQELRGKLGPAGGTLAGEPGTVFEGLELVIARGALAEETTITITPTADATPLPLGAEACGPGFAFAPQDLALSAPASLTLPVFADMPAYLGHDDGEVKVWGRTADGWVRSDATATAAGSVTIAITSLTTFAAGVKVAPQPPACSTIAGCVSADGTCTSANGFCVTSVGVPSPNYFPGSFASDGKAAYYPSSVASKILAVRYDLTTHALAQSPALDLFAFFSGLDNVVVDANGHVWAATSVGNVDFPFGGTLPARFDLGAKDYGAIATARGTMVRLTDSGYFVRTPLGFLASPFPQSSGGVARGASADPSAPDSFWTTTGTKTLQRFSVTNLALEKTLTIPNPYVINGSVVPSVSSDGSVALRAFALSAPEAVIVFPPTGSPKISTSLPRMSGAPRFDASGALWIQSAATPELFILGTDGGLMALALTASTDSGSSDYLGHVPRVSRVLPDDSVLVLTVGGEFVRVRRGQ